MGCAKSHENFGKTSKSFFFFTIHADAVVGVKRTDRSKRVGGEGGEC